MKHCRDCQRFEGSPRANVGYEAGKCTRLNRRVAGHWPVCTHLTQRDGFATWMQAVDNEVWALVGVSVHDLPDCLYRDWYDDSTNPKIAAKRAIKQATSFLCKARADCLDCYYYHYCNIAKGWRCHLWPPHDIREILQTRANSLPSPPQGH